MTDAKPKHANFPERDFKVLIGANINATTTKTLTRLSIGGWEMSFIQQENGAITANAAKSALNAIGRPLGVALATEESKEFVGVFDLKCPDQRIQLWITTPFELKQSAHVIWCKITETAGEGKVGVAFKLATAYTVDDINNLIKAAQRNMVKLPEGETYVLKGNPPPRFVKKAKADAPAEAAPAEAAAAASEAAPNAEG
jgi:hypothetical protein